MKSEEIHPKLVSLLDEGPIVVTMGLAEFTKNLLEQNLHVVEVDWTPPAGGDRELTELLDQIL